MITVVSNKACGFNKLNDKARKINFQREILLLVDSSHCFRLLLMSDLHYDSTAIDAAAESQKQLIDSLFNLIEKEHNHICFDAILMTGDLAAKNPKTDLIDVRAVIQEIVQKSIGERNIDRLFLIPGNHDVVWEKFEDDLASDRPWAPFLDLYALIYLKRPDIIAELSSCNEPAFKLQSALLAITFFAFAYAAAASLYSPFAAANFPDA